MTIKRLKDIILEGCNDVYFYYNGYQCGVTSEVCDGIWTFIIWYGKEIKEWKHIDRLLTDRFYGGKSLTDLIDKVEIRFA